MTWLKKLMPVLLAAALILSAVVCCAAEQDVQPELKSVSEIKASVLWTGDPPQAADTYYIVISADDESYPMPEGTENGEYRRRVEAGQSVLLPQIVYDKVGIYTYTICQQVLSEENANPNVLYDETVYILKVTIYQEEETGRLMIAVALRREASGQKQDQVIFINERLYTLTIEYRYLNGEIAAPTVYETHHIGDPYDIPSPDIPGYRCTIVRIAGNQPARDVRYIVYYIPVGPATIGSAGYRNAGDCME